MRQIADAINFIFSAAGCKGEEIQKDELCFLNLSWENKNFLVPKFKIVHSNPGFQENFNQLREDNLFFDGVIEVENQFIPVHRCLLAVNSTVFLEMFKNEWLGDNKIIFQNETLKTIQLFLNFLYQGSTVVTNNLDEIFSLIEFANRYSLINLYNSCILLLKEIINFENIIDIYLFGQKIGCGKILEDCKHQSKLIKKSDKPTNDFSSIRDLSYLLKIYQIAKKLELNKYIDTIDVQLIQIAEYPDLYMQMEEIAKQLELGDLMETINNRLLFNILYGKLFQGSSAL